MSRRTHHPSGTRTRATPGFTLVELLTSIGIIIFVLSIAILAVGPALRSAGARDAARRLRAVLDSARLRAIQQRRTVRFEAQRMVPSPEKWGAAPNAGDPIYQWTELPEFVAVRIKANGDNMSKSFADVPTVFTISFKADGSVRVYSVDGTSSDPNPTTPFLLRLHTTREAPIDEVRLSCAFIEITPLTGVIRSYTSDEAADADLPTKQ